VPEPHLHGVAAEPPADVAPGPGLDLHVDDGGVRLSTTATGAAAQGDLGHEVELAALAVADGGEGPCLEEAGPGEVEPRRDLRGGEPQEVREERVQQLRENLVVAHRSVLARGARPPPIVRRAGSSIELRRKTAGESDTFSKRFGHHLVGPGRREEAARVEAPRPAP
jgi:hypothetical protein